jgi:hypothetical protein
VRLLTEIIQNVETQNIATQNVATSTPDAPPSACDANWATLCLVAGIALALAVVGFALLAVLGLFKIGPLHLNESSDPALPDTPPIEYAYLDSLRASAYLGEVEGGLATSEQRTNEVTRSLSATLAVGTAATFGGSSQTQQTSVTTITPRAAEHFYTFLQRLHKRGEADYLLPKTCKEGLWLGEIDDESSRRKIIEELECLGVGNFVRIKNAQLFLPPFAQTLPRVRSANTFRGQLPAPRIPFTSPTQSIDITRALHKYAQLIGTNPRMPFVAAPYGNPQEIGDKKNGGGIPVFLPALYRGLTLEPSLLSGSVTIVGEIVYYANHGPAYVDYPTVSKFGRALLQAKTALRVDLGVCSKTTAATTRPHETIGKKGSNVRNERAKARGGSQSQKARCTSRQETLREVRGSVTFKPPFVVVLPLAIYG